MCRTLSSQHYILTHNSFHALFTCTLTFHPNHIPHTNAQSSALFHSHTSFRTSQVHDELQKVRNVRPGFRLGLVPGLLHALVDTYLLRGGAPWTWLHG